MRYKVFGYLPADMRKRKLLTNAQVKRNGGFLPGQNYKKYFKLFGPNKWRELTAKAIAPTSTSQMPDILCVQEVESMDALRRFNEDFLDKYYEKQILMDAHDPRRIDVGILTNYKIGNIKTHMYVPYTGQALRGRKYIFTRDLLEVSLETPGGQEITVFITHLKSKYGSNQDKNNKIRNVQAKEAAKIIKKRFPGNSFQSKNFVLVGDFNDMPNSAPLKPLVRDLGMDDAISWIPNPEERWTYWYSGGNIASQIDFILVSPKIERNSNFQPFIERRGLNKEKMTYARLNKRGGKKIPFDFPRFEGTTKKVGASDHCPVFLDMEIT